VYPEFALAVVKTIIEAVLLTATVLLALKVVNLFTKNFDEWKEIHKGNVSVAIYMSGMIISVGFIVQPGIQFFLSTISLDLWGSRATTIFYAMANGILQLVVAFAVAIVVQFLALFMLKHVHLLMAPYNEWEEMEKGNIAAGIIMGVVLALIGILLSGAMNSILDLIRVLMPPEIAGILRAVLF
jgi:uncharacterized membrane protein YjfL (UPF0719 family)